MAWKSKEYARQYHTEYMRGRRRLYRQLGLCAECGTEDAYTMAGHYRCFECSEKRRKTPIEYIKPEKPVRENFRKDESRCYLCGSPVMQGETAYGGRPIRLCEKHYAFIVQMGAKGREAGSAVANLRRYAGT